LPAPTLRRYPLFVWLFHGPWLAFKRAVDVEDWPSASATLNHIRQVIAVNLPLGLLVVVIGGRRRYWGQFQSDGFCLRKTSEARNLSPVGSPLLSCWSCKPAAKQSADHVKGMTPVPIHIPARPCLDASDSG